MNNAILVEVVDSFNHLREELAAVFFLNATSVFYELVELSIFSEFRDDVLSFALIVII